MAERLKIAHAEHGVIMSHPGADRIPEAVESARELGRRYQHYGWPGVTRTLAGDILASASERITHVDPFGREVVSRSTDNGRTWSEPEVIFDSVTDDRDHAINTLPDGTVVSTWFSSSAWARSGFGERPAAWADLARRLSADTLSALSRGWLRRSNDGGRTWEDAVYPTIVGQHAGPTPLANGDLVYCGPVSAPAPRVVATLSQDGGRTWRIVGEVSNRTATNSKTGVTRPIFDENHTLELAPGRLLTVYRGLPNVHAARSDDAGRTWTEPEDTGAFGHPAYLVRLAAGPVLCVYANRTEPRTIRAMLSYDEGVSWDAERAQIVRQFDYKSDMGYPVALETGPNEILCVYYSVPGPTTEGYAEGKDFPAGILSTRFALEAE